jgi:ABC-2 type transport system permease protein
VSLRHDASTIRVLWAREVRLLVRQRSRLVGALAQPLLFWIVLGAGFAPSFVAPGAEDGPGYMTYLFPGIVVLVVLFASIFTTMSVIEDRRAGFLQGVLVAPGSRTAVALGKCLGGATVAMLHVVPFLLLAPLAGLPWGGIAWGATLLALALASLALTGLGFVLAWWLDSTQGYHAIMSVVLLPLWILSGALFPFEPAHAALRWAGRLDPMTYAVAAVRGAMGGATDVALTSSLTVLAVLASLALTAAATAARRRG